MKYLAGFREHFRERTVFLMRECRLFLKEKGISDAYLHFLIHYLLKRGELKRVTRGIYTFRDDPMAAGFAFTPFYYGLQEALSLHNLWQQETNPVVLSPRRVRGGVREVLGQNMVIHRIAPEMFFGYELKQYDDFWVPVSDVEKTLIDFAYFREHLEEEALAEIKARLREDVLKAYLKKVPEKVVRKVRGWLAGESAIGSSRTAHGFQAQRTSA